MTEDKQAQADKRASERALAQRLTGRCILRRSSPATTIAFTTPLGFMGPSDSRTCYTPWPVFRDVSHGLGLVTTADSHPARRSCLNNRGLRLPGFRPRSAKVRRRPGCAKSGQKRHSSRKDHTRSSGRQSCSSVGSLSTAFGPRPQSKDTATQVR